MCECNRGKQASSIGNKQFDINKKRRPSSNPKAVHQESCTHFISLTLAYIVHVSLSLTTKLKSYLLTVVTCDTERVWQAAHALIKETFGSYTISSFPFFFFLRDTERDLPGNWFPFSGKNESERGRGPIIHMCII